MVHITLKDYRGTYLIHESLVLTSLPFKTGINHRSMGKNRGEPLIVKLYRHCGHLLLPLSYELHHPVAVFTRAAIILFGVTYHHPLDILTLNILFEVAEKIGRAYGGKPARHYLQRVSDRQPTTFFTIVHRQYSCHVPAYLSL